MAETSHGFRSGGGPTEVSWRLLNSAVLQSKEAILITDAQLDAPGPRIIFVNPAFTAMTGYGREEIVGRTPRILQGPRTDREVLRRLRRNLELGEVFAGEAINYRKDRTEFILEWQIAPIRNSAGTITHFVAIQRDISERRRAEIAAVRLAAIVESSLDAIIGKDLDGIVTSWNRGATSLFGYTAEEMIGTPILRLIPPERHPEEERILASIRRGESVNHFETVRQAKDGRLVDVSITVSPIKNAAGVVVGISKAARDITERKRHEAARHAAEARYHTLFEHAPDGILIADPRGNFLDANASVCRMLGYTRDELMGLSAPAIVMSAEAKNVGLALGAISAGAEYHREWLFRRKDGSPVPTDVRATLMPDGNLMSLLRDVTERKRAEAKIAEQAAFMDEARDAIVVRGLDGRIVYWNKGAERIYGWPRSEVLGRDAGELLHCDKKKFAEGNRIILAEGEWRAELQHAARDGRELTVETRWTLLRDAEGHPKSILAINTDVTERKKIEAQFMRAQRMESIGTLAGGIAHDLNNILAPIMMSIDILKTLTDHERAAKILETIEVSTRRGADIVRQVLSFSRGLDGERVEIQPRHLLGDLETMIKDTFPKDIRLHFSIARDIWTILGDPTQVHQILLNLCVNARDAMPNGGRLEIAVENTVLDENYAAMNIQAKPGRYVNIRVTDSGIGIPAAIIDKIFDPFFTTKDLTKGTGLGLSTVLAVVKSHEGVVNVYSEPGKGTTFKVYLPAAEPASSPVKDHSDQANLPRGQGELILVVDDEASILSITSQTLQAFGYRALTAANGADALAVYLQHRDEVALVLTDTMMPIMDGAALIHALMRVNGAVKVIAASGLSANGETASMTGIGVAHFLTKPYTAQTLLKMLREVLAKP